MSRILLDSSAYSAYTGGHPDLQEPVRHASTIHLSVVVVGELLAAFLKGGRRRQNEARLRQFAAEPRVRVLPVRRDVRRDVVDSVDFWPLGSRDRFRNPRHGDPELP